MSDQQKILNAWLAEEAKNKSRNRRKKKLPDDGGVTINSLMDAVTIILIFLLMNFSSDPMKVTPHEKLQLPLSTTQIGVKEKTITLTVDADHIFIDDEIVADIKNNEVNSSDPNSLVIEPLKVKLEEKVEKTRKLNRLMKKDFKDIITIIAHGETHYRLINNVIYTAGLASFTKFKFAVVKGGILQQKL